MSPVQPVTGEGFDYGSDADPDSLARKIDARREAHLERLTVALRSLTDGVEGEEWPRWLGHLPWDVREVYKRVVREAREALR